MGVIDAVRLSTRVSVIIPVCNGGTAFVQCLRAILKGNTQPKEIIVAANGCRDRSEEVARLAGAEVISFPQPIGPAAARNAAARLARGNILFFVDADVAVHPDALARVRDNFATRPDITACFGSYDDQPPATGFFSQYKNLFHHFTHQNANSEANTFWAGCGAIRRSVFEQVGGFDEAYRDPAIEDIELGYRLTARGHRIYLDSHLQATHLKCWRLVTVLKSDIMHRALPWSRLIWIARSMPNDLNTRQRNRYSVGLSLFLGLYLLAAMLTRLPIWPAFVPAALLLLLNFDWYRYLRRRKGLLWTLPAILWHWFYYFYCGAAFTWAALEHLYAKRPFGHGK